MVYVRSVTNPHLIKSVLQSSPETQPWHRQNELNYSYLLDTGYICFRWYVLAVLNY